MNNKKRYPLKNLFGRILSPFENFLHSTTSGGLVLIGTTLLALLLATVMGNATFHHFWNQSFALSVENAFELKLSWHHWVNDGLMTLFFLLVGLELKREILVGELASLKDAALPVIAALGGMIVPALIYTGFNPLGTATASGWGIPMATDIAFAIGILVLLGERIPKNLIIFLTALAIADDLGAVLVIALFYTSHVNLYALGIAGALFVGLMLLNQGGIRRSLPYTVIGILLWYALLTSGIHATLAGILIAMAIPALSTYQPKQFQQRISELSDAFAEEQHEDTSHDALSNHRMASIAGAMERTAEAVQSPLQRMEHTLSPWVTFLIIPIFALSNAGIDLSAIEWEKALAQPITLGVTFGLVIGKFLGISVFSWLAIQFGVGRLPNGVNWKHLLGAAWLGGIGFTMSLFIGQLAFNDPIHIEEAKLGILLASIASALLGVAWLYIFSDKGEPNARTIH
ncbi:MAG: Na+/H+ antiporter NhaA [Pseudomonadota bacterium]